MQVPENGILYKSGKIKECSVLTHDLDMTKTAQYGLLTK